MKKYIYTFVICLTVILTGIFISSKSLAQSIPGAQQWFYNIIGNYLYPLNSGAGIRVPSLASSGDCVTTDSDGDFGLDTCGTGGGGGATTSINSLQPSNGAFIFSSGNPSFTISTTSPRTVTFTVSTTTIQGLITGTSPISVSGGVVSLQGNFGSLNVTTSGFVNSTSTLVTNATTSNLSITSVTGALLSTDGVGYIKSTTTPYVTNLIASNGASLPKLTNLTSNGFVITGSGNGTLSVDTTSYQPAGTYVTSVTGSGNIASSGGTTPNITFTGILPVINGGTGNSILQNSTIPIGNGTGPFATSSAFTFATSTSVLTVTNISNTNSTSTNISGTNIYVVGQTPAFVAFDPNGKLVATTTPSGGGTPCTTTGNSMQYNNNGTFGCSSKLLTDGTVIGYNATSSTISVYLQGTSGSANDILRVASSSAATFLSIKPSGLIGIGTSTQIATLDIQGQAGFMPFRVSSSTGASLVEFEQNGRVGINSTTPGALLTLQGYSGSAIDLLQVASSTGVSVLTVSTSSTAPTLLVQGVSTAPIVFQAASSTGTGILTVSSNGQVGINTSTAPSDFSVIGVTANATSTAAFGSPTQPTCQKWFSPNGTAYYVTMTNAGALSVSATTCKSGF